MTDAELKALLDGENPQTDEQALGAGMRGQGGTSSVSQRSQTAEDLYAAGIDPPREKGGYIREPVDPRSEFTEEETEQYLAGEKEITLPGTDTVHSFKPSKPSATPAPPSMKVASQITNKDILDLAQSGEFPDDLEHPQEDMDRWLTPSAVPLKQVYSEIEDPLDRAVFLKDHRDRVAKQRFDEIYRRELKPQLYTALAAGTAVTSLGVLAYSAPAAVALLSGMSRNQLANLAVDAGVDLTFDLGTLYLLHAYITSDSDEEKAELEEKFEQSKKDSGSPAITDVSANQAE